MISLRLTAGAAGAPTVPEIATRCKRATHSGPLRQAPARSGWRCARPRPYAATAPGPAAAPSAPQRSPRTPARPSPAHAGRRRARWRARPTQAAMPASIHQPLRPRSCRRLDMAAQASQPSTRLATMPRQPTKLALVTHRPAAKATCAATSMTAAQMNSARSHRPRGSANCRTYRTLGDMGRTAHSNASPSLHPPRLPPR